MDNHELQSAVDEIKRIDEERLALNAEKQKVRKSLKAEGVNLKGFDLAVKMSKLDSEERQEMDNNYVEVRAAIGIPIQNDLFTPSGAA